MTLPINEQPLYGEMLIETSPWATPFVWTDRTASLVAGFNYSQGGRVGTAGSSQVEVGTLNATFKNLASVPAVGALVRISFSSFAGYAFVGYVQDVSQRIVFDNSISFTTPITLTTLNCVDWVGYISQFNAVGAGSISTPSNSNYRWTDRLIGLNRIVDSSGSTQIIEWAAPATNSGYFVGDTDLVASFPDHIDLLCNSNPRLYWYPNTVLPTNITTGRTNLVTVKELSIASSSGITFTDLVGTAGQLHYTEIDLQNSSQNVANVVVVNNRTRLDIVDPEITRIGGFNEENYMVINNVNTVGVAVDTTMETLDSTSITTYGSRRSEFSTTGNLNPSGLLVYNLIANPSVEYSDDGYSGIANSRVRRRQPLQDANPFAAYNGSWAMRVRQSTAAASTRISFSGGEADGIPVVGGTTYYIRGYAARGTVSRTDMISSMTIEWFNDDEASISTSTTANTTLTTANTWYLVSGSAVAPATAVRATIRMSFARSGGGNISVGDRLWGDAFMLGKTSTTYFDGDTQTSTNQIFGWTGGLGASPSFRTANSVDDIASAFVNRYSTTSMRVTRIRWNAQENLASIPSLSVGKTLSLVYKGTTTTYRIVGIDGNVDPERYMIDYYLEKV